MGIVSGVVENLERGHAPWASLRRLCGELPHPNQIVGAQGQGQEPLQFPSTPMPGLAEHSNIFQPTEDLFDP